MKAKDQIDYIQSLNTGKQYFVSLNYTPNLSQLSHK